METGKENLCFDLGIVRNISKFQKIYGNKVYYITQSASGQDEANPAF